MKVDAFNADARKVDASPAPWDVVIIGGALSGAATALQLLDRAPRLRILILERSEKFDRRVGESTVEISSFFLTRVLDLAAHLQEKHIIKQGLRFWFQNERTATFDQCAEIGPRYNVRLPGFQVDRAVLDEEILARAAARGVVVRRPVRVRDVTLRDGGLQTVAWEDASGAQGADSARWLVDASGVAALLSRKNGWLQVNAEHPTASCWSRWSGVKNWDSRELADRAPAWSARVKTLRSAATNHLVGRGWWAWFIQLKGGDVSVGVVFDQRLADLPPGKNLGERLRAMLCEHPVGRELLADASWREGDVHFRRNLAYRSTTFAGDGFALVGDAAAFIDPFYSPGMDWIAYTTSSTATLIASALAAPRDAEASTSSAASLVARHNEKFSLCHDRWFRALYKDKYYYMGDHELMSLAFRLDFAAYYLGVVVRHHKNGRGELDLPAFTGPRAPLPARLIAFYNRRLVAIAQDRWRRGAWGRRNHGGYFAFRSYELGRELPWRALKAVAAYAALELREGWRTWLSMPAFDARKPGASPSRALGSAAAPKASTLPDAV